MAIQLPVFSREWRSERKRERAYGLGPILIRSIWAESTHHHCHGLFALLTTLICLGFQGDIRLTNLTNIIAAASILAFGLLFRKRPFETDSRWLFKILFVFALLEGIELTSRYLFQYEIMCTLMTSVLAFGKCTCTCASEGRDFRCHAKHFNTSAPLSDDHSICPFWFTEIGLEHTTGAHSSSASRLNAPFVLIVTQMLYATASVSSRAPALR